MTAALVRDLIDALPCCCHEDCYRPSLIVDHRDYYHRSYHCLEHTEYMRGADGGVQLADGLYDAAPWAEAVIRAVEEGIVSGE